MSTGSPPRHRPRTRLLLSLACTAALGCAGSALSGCNGGGGGGGIGNAAVQATLPTVFADLRSGRASFDTQLTGGASVSMPLATFVAASNVVQNGIALGGESGDGTATVDVSVTVNHDANDGSRVVTIEVRETSTGFVFLTGRLEFGALSLQARALPYSFAGLSPTTGSGEAFIAVRATQQVHFERTFHNVSTSTSATFLSPAINPLPPTTASGDVVLETDVLLDYAISASATGLQAQLLSADAISASLLRTVDGGASASAHTLRFDVIRVAGQGIGTGGDVVVAVGQDATNTGFFQDGDALHVEATITGGVSGATVLHGVSGAVTNGIPSGTAGASFVLADTLDVDTTEVDDAEIDLALITFTAFSGQPVPTFGHTLGNLADSALAALSAEVLIDPAPYAYTTRPILVVH